MPFASQVVFVTGGGTGMGRLAAQRLADAGAAQTKLAQLLRSFVPVLVWSMVHRVEGR
jgi:hypothetical protein